MIRVKMFCDWGHDSQDLIDKLEDQTTGMSEGCFKNLQFVADNDYEYGVCFNYPNHDFECPKENVLVLMLEPPEVLDRLYPRDITQKDYSPIKIQTFVDDVNYGVGFATVSKDFVSSQTNRARACMIVSNKVITSFQRKRREVLEALLETDLPIDFYGRAMQSRADPRVKGEIPPGRKDQVISRYQYCIDFENAPQAVTDKYFDAVLCGTKPITNAVGLRAILPDSCEVVDFDKSISDIVDIIDTIIKSNQDPDEEALEVARKEILQGKFSLAEWIYQRIENRSNDE